MSHPMDSRSATARWPWLVLGVFVLLVAVGVTLVGVNGESVAEQIGFVLAFGMFGVVGALITSRDRGNRVGLLLLYGSCATAAQQAAGEVATALIVRGVTSGPVVTVAAVIGDAGWILGILPVVFLLPLLFPDGGLPSRRWRPLIWWGMGFLSLLLVVTIFGTERLSGSNEALSIRNPLVVPALAGSGDPPGLGLLLIGTIGLSVASLIVRFRRSRGVERQQIKWVAFAALVLFVSLLGSELLLALGYESALIDSLLIAGAFLLLPVSVGVAVLRYRLYDLDVVVRKALVAAVLAAFIALAYGGIVAAGTVLLGRDDPTLGVIAAVVLALAFQPARVRARKLVDRLVYGRRATPYEVLSEFSERVAESYAADDVLDRMARVLGEGIGAEHADVWLRIGAELRVAASWPEERPSPLVPVDDRPPLLPRADAVFDVEHRGELLGALTIAKPVSDPVTPADRKLAEGLAAQAGLVLRNVRLTEELRARLEDLRTAQKRLVAAQDEERRKLERNIHDGAQQQLVALSVRLRLAQQLISRDPTKADEMLTSLQGEVTETLEDLRDLARGIYPPLLADKGLPAALEAQARRSPVPVEVEPDGVRRYPQEVEAAVYFSCLEALNNVAKYADASRATVTLLERDEELRFEVADDGRGFDPSETGYGTGMQGMADRLRALDGDLEVRSSPGSGTTVAGRIPIPGGSA